MGAPKHRFTTERRLKKRPNLNGNPLIEQGRLSPAKSFVAILALIFSAEFVVMFVLNSVKIRNPLLESFLDSLCLTTIVTPALWMILVKPFQMVLDSTEARTQREIRESEARLRAIFDNAPVGIARMSIDGKFQQVNPKFADFLEMSVNDLQGRSFAQLLGSKEKSGLKAIPTEFKRLMDGEATVSVFDRTVTTGSGKEREYHLTLSAIRGQYGHIHDVICVLSDTTEQNQLKRENTEKAGLLDKITWTIPSVVYLYSFRTGKINIFTEEFFRILGYPPREVRPEGQWLFEDLVHPEDRLEFQLMLAKVEELEEGEFIELDYRLKDSQGEWHWFRSRHTPFDRGKDGKLQQIFGYAIERRRMFRDGKVVELNIERRKPKAA